MKIIGDVVCSIIERDNCFLIAQRAPGASLAFKWEFPGGKVNKGESEQEALRREIIEELGVEINVGERLTPRYHAYESFEINLIPYLCTILDGEPHPHEHNNIMWVNCNTVRNYDMADADKPILEEYLKKREIKL